VNIRILHASVKFLTALSVLNSIADNNNMGLAS
jgi:hypothetical protein